MKTIFKGTKSLVKGVYKGTSKALRAAYNSLSEENSESKDIESEPKEVKINNDIKLLNSFIMDGKIKPVEDAIKYQHNVNIPHIENNVGWYPIAVAVVEGKTDIVRLLINSNADLTVMSPYGFTLIQEAMQRGHKEIIAALVCEGGKNINEQDKKGNTLLHDAIACQNYDMASFLITIGACPDIQNKERSTALHLACKDISSKNILPLLLGSVKQLSLKDNAQDTVLHIAAKHGFNEAIRLLIEHRAYVDANNKQQFSALYITASAGNIEGTKILVEEGKANINGLNISYNITPLILAAKQGQDKIVCYLVKNGANINAIESTQGSSCLHWAAVKCKAGTIEFLLKQGADKFIKNKKAQTAFDFCRVKNINDNKILKAVNPYEEGLKRDLKSEGKGKGELHEVIEGEKHEAPGNVSENSKRSKKSKNKNKQKKQLHHKKNDNKDKLADDAKIYPDIKDYTKDSDSKGAACLAGEDTKNSDDFVSEIE